MTDSKNLIYLKFSHGEAINGKKDMLSLQANALNTIKHINNYKKLRIEELKNKIKISKKIKSLKLDILKLEKNLPKIKLPKILQKEIKKELSQDEIKNLAKYGTVEEQLRLIQKKLKALEGN